MLVIMYYPTVNIFVAIKMRFKNPITAILADTYLALDLCHQDEKAILLSAYFVYLVDGSHW